MVHVLVAAFKIIPLLLSFAWIFGAVIFYWNRERNSPAIPVETNILPPISIIVPCHNEELTIANTIAALDRLQYPEFEIIAVNDGSSDHTQAVLENLALSQPRMRVINVVRNKGKGAALNVGIVSSRYDHVVCIDADSELDPYAPRWLIPHLTQNANVAAVTGNPRVKNRGTLVGRIQVGEFSVCVGIIRRYHQVIGKLGTMSGVLMAFKKRALFDIGLLDTDCITEDIAVTWKLQRAGWDVRFEPRALCDVLMPDTIKGLWKQRVRWASGGFDTMIRNLEIVFWPNAWALKVLYLEYFLSAFWTFTVPVLVIVGLMLHHHGVSLLSQWFSPWGWTVCLTGLFSALMFIAGFWMHERYEKGVGKFGYWAIWYPFLYWVLNGAAFLVSVPKVLFGKRVKFSTWISPDRGVLSYESMRLKRIATE